jgi:hypothetical protein
MSNWWKGSPIKTYEGIPTAYDSAVTVHLIEQINHPMFQPKITDHVTQFFCLYSLIP